MQEKLQNLKNEALALIIQAQSAEELERIRVKFLGKKTWRFPAKAAAKGSRCPFIDNKLDNMTTHDSSK